MADETKMAPLPWRRNEYGDVLDATGQRVSLVGFAMACGYVPEDDERRRSADTVLKAVNAYGPMRKALDMLREQIKVRIDPALLEELGRASVGDMTIRADVLLACLRALSAAEGNE